MKSYVLARKGVLLSNPDVANMSPLQWAMEYHGLMARERDQNRTLKFTLMNLLGLDLVIPRDENGTIKTELTIEEMESNYRPLTLWLAEPERLEDFMKSLEELKVLKELEKEGTAGEVTSYEAMVAAHQPGADLDDTDIEPFIPAKIDLNHIREQDELKIAQRNNLISVVGDAPTPKRMSFEEV